MDTRQFVQNVLALADTITAYESGASGENGKCDCIGLVIGALELGGTDWNGTHGTNYAFRNEMRYASPLEDATELQEGMVVYKSKSPGESGYALPDKYKQGGDMNDYYHVGVVTHVEPLTITHCTSPGPIVQDTSAKKWQWYGELDKLSPIGETEPEEYVTMYVQGGKKLALRNGPGKNYQALVWIPAGAQVQAAPYNGEWLRVRYGKYTGYSMAEFLAETPEESADNVLVELDKATANKLLEALKKAIK